MSGGFVPYLRGYYVSSLSVKLGMSGGLSPQAKRLLREFYIGLGSVVMHLPRKYKMCFLRKSPYFVLSCP